VAAYAAISLAETSRAAGGPQPDAWRTATSVSDAVGSWMLAYTQYRLGEALLGAHAPRREAETSLTEAVAIARRLGALPLIGWIEGLAKRARIALESTEAVDEPVIEVPSSSGELGLTTREREVLSLVAEGYTNRRIAETLFISESTAGVHVSNILGKLGVASRTEAAAVAARLGIAG
jgi:DNA-binding CsgD family transcriptional regulator